MQEVILSCFYWNINLVASLYSLSRIRRKNSTFTLSIAILEGTKKGAFRSAGVSISKFIYKFAIRTENILVYEEKNKWW